MSTVSHSYLAADMQAWVVNQHESLHELKHPSGHDAQTTAVLLAGISWPLNQQLASSVAGPVRCSVNFMLLPRIRRCMSQPATLCLMMPMQVTVGQPAAPTFFSYEPTSGTAAAAAAAQQSPLVVALAEQRGLEHLSRKDASIVHAFDVLDEEHEVDAEALAADLCAGIPCERAELQHGDVRLRWGRGAIS